MDKKSRISFGPGAASIILILVILSMSVLGILSLISAREAKKLSLRSSSVIEAVYALNGKAEASFAALDAVTAKAASEGGTEEQILGKIAESLPDGMTMEDKTVRWTETDEVRDLSCAAEIISLGDGERLKWTEHRLTAITVEDAWN
jgi:hypothetical protein